MTQLSPAAQAVLDAATKELDYVPIRHVQWVAAAALRSLADQVVPEEDWPDQSIGFADWNLATECCEQRKNTRIKIYGIATELEGGR